jgi:hypothetical protein
MRVRVRPVVAAGAFLVALILTLSPGSAYAGTAEEIAALPTLDSLSRAENPLSNSGKWSALYWANTSTGHATGQDTASGWGPNDGYFTGSNGAYWNPTTFKDNSGSAASLTMQVSPGIEQRYLSLWLDMPGPGSAKSGYELRWAVNPNVTNIYTVNLSKWSSGTETVLTSNAEVSIANGTTMAISDTGSTVTAWKSSGGTLSSLLSASDTTYSSGYAGIEGAGNISRSINFKAGTFPEVKTPTVTTKAASAIKGTGATLNATVNPNGVATTYQFEYGATTSYGSKAPVSAQEAGAGSSAVEVSQPITGLTPGTDYHYRISATNANGTSKGTDQALTTAAAPSPTTEAASEVQAKEATLKASVNPKGADTTYQFEYGATTSYGSKAPATAKGIGSGTSTVEASEVLTGLTEGATYHYRVVAANEVGTTYGADRVFTALYLPVATTQGAAAVDGTEVTLTGTVDPNESETEYSFEYGTSTAYGSSGPAAENEIGDGDEAVEVMAAPAELSPETTYHYRIVATSPAGTAVGGDQTVTTGAASSGQNPTLGEDFVGVVWSGIHDIEAREDEMEVINQSGAKMLRFSVEWHGDMKPWWDKYDEIFLHAAERGIRILPNLGLNGDKGINGFPTSENDVKGWQEFVVAAYKRYGPGGEVWSKLKKGSPLPAVYWEVGNENNYFQWNPHDVNPEQFGQFLADTSAALSSASNGSAKVVLGGLISMKNKVVSTGAEGNGLSKGDIVQLRVIEFLDQMHKGRNAFDVLAIHPYAFLVDGHEPRTENQTKDIRQKVWEYLKEGRDALNLIGQSSKRMWITELGWPVKPALEVDAGHPAVTEEIQAELISRVFAMVMADAGTFKIDHILYYNTIDYNGNSNWAYRAGLRRRIDDNHVLFKKGFGAFRVAANKDDSYPRHPRATTKGAKNKKAHSSTAEGQIDPEGLWTLAHFEWGPVSNPAANSTQPRVAGFEDTEVGFSEQISKLNPSTKYTYRVIAENEAGEVDPGEYVTFETPPSSSTSTNVKRVLHGQPGWVWVDGWVKEGYVEGPEAGPGLGNVHVHVKLFRNGQFVRFEDVVTNGEGHYDSGYMVTGKGNWEVATEFPGGGEWDASESPNRQTFTVRDGVRIRAKHSDKCMDIFGAYSTNGAAVMHGDCNEPPSANQVFTLAPVGNGQYFQIVPRNSGRCVDVVNVSTANGAGLQQYDCLGANQANQLFSEAWWGETPYVSYVAKHSQKCLDVTGANQGWTNFQQWTCNEAFQQRFRLEPVESGPIPTETSLTPRSIIHGAPGYVTVTGYLKAGAYSMAGRIVHAEFEKLEGGSWIKKADRAITVNGDGSYRYGDEGVGQGQWRVRALFVGNGEFGGSASSEHYFTISGGNRLVSRASNKCLSLSENKNVNGQHLIMWGCSGGPSYGDGQVFRFWPVGNNIYEVTVVSSGKCLDIANASSQNGGDLQQWDCNHNGQQRWELLPIDGQSGWYALRPQHVSGKCLEVWANATNDGAKVDQWDCHWGGNQQWQLQGVL